MKRRHKLQLDMVWWDLMTPGQNVQKLKSQQQMKKRKRNLSRSHSHPPRRTEEMDVVQEEEKPAPVEEVEAPQAVVEEEQEVPDEAADEETPADDQGHHVEEVLEIKPRVKKLANQFNFCERAALTYVFPRRLKKKAAKNAKTAQQIHDEQLAQRIREAWTVLERLVNQNIYDDISQDYRYWDDPSDEFREGMGSLLPLWKFQYEPMRNHAVCDVQWNPHYQDLFAVAYGSLDFTAQQKNGCLCLYSIKNPAFPEYSVVTESPVICLDVYKEIPYLICIGMYDGNVCVYNAQLTLESSYQYKSDAVRDKHSNIVWEVRWGARLIDGEASFFSISGDGRVVQWAVMPGELQATTIITLSSSVPPISGPDGTLLRVNSCGSTICFHPEKEEIFMVGAEDGMVHTCSLKYNRNYVRSVQGHHMPVYRISYNYYNNSLYATCSGDWRVKIWEDGRDTVFAACTADGKVYVYDLNVNKYRPICVQAVLSPNLRVMCKPPKKAQGIQQRTLQVHNETR
ncbi:unnamed protein product [Leptidea sinapis]|uniref:Dynein intermediate chain 2, ciliary n=1 Tax=Leptidea sinapis TaxID=189913 RepID=A0A5E4R5A0_9NEOP|nr:unnamed protein product [Leptidea sinapis]